MPGEFIWSTRSSTSGAWSSACDAEPSRRDGCSAWAPLHAYPPRRAARSSAWSLGGGCPPKSGTGRWSPQRSVNRVTVGGLVVLILVDTFIAHEDRVVVEGVGFVLLAVLVACDLGVFIEVPFVVGRCSALGTEQ